MGRSRLGVDDGEGDSEVGHEGEHEADDQHGREGARAGALARQLPLLHAVARPLLRLHLRKRQGARFSFHTCARRGGGCVGCVSRLCLFEHLLVQLCPLGAVDLPIVVLVEHVEEGRLGEVRGACG